MENYKSTYTGSQIDAAIGRALPGGEIDQLRPNRNLLDNWYFANPVDQRGGYVVPPGKPAFNKTTGAQEPHTTSYVRVTGYADDTDGAKSTISTGQTVLTSDCVRGYTGAGYTVDRWKLQNDSGTVLINDDGSLTIIAGEGGTQFVQTFEQLSPSMWCISAIVRAVHGNVEVVLQKDGGDWDAPAITAVGTGMIYASGKPNSRTERYNVIFSFGQNASVTIEAVKLELGDHQTLAHQDENGNWVLNELPDYGEQSRRCQRYFWRSWTGERNIQNSILGVVFAMNHRIAGFDYPVEMRTKPSITVYGLTGEGKVTERKYDNDYGPVSPLYWDTQRCVALVCDEAGLSDDDRVYYFIEANAEL